ncbi:MAG: hypothetical protein ABH896_01260, partial [Candidatus Jacksonbacteria bacterium]
LSAGSIANKSKIHRRNVYDTLKKLIERGLVFEVMHKAEDHFKAADPDKLMEIVAKKEKALAKIMPELTETYRQIDHNEDVYIYKGIEGWKNNMQDILQYKPLEVYYIDAKAPWLDPRLRQPFLEFAQKARAKKIKFYILFDPAAKKSALELKKHLGDLEYKFLPKGYSTSCNTQIYNNRVEILSNISLNKFDAGSTTTFIINQNTADAFRTWFWFLWDSIT